METLKSDFKKILATLSESIKDIIICLNSDSEILFINPQAKKIYGDVVKHVEYQDFIALHSKKSTSNKLISSLKKRQLIPIKEKVSFKKQEILITWSITYYPNNKKPKLILLCGKNIADKKIKAKDLSSENIKLKNYITNIIDVIPGSLYWKDRDGTYLGCNNVMVKEARVQSTKDIIGKTDHDLWSGNAEKIRANDLEVMRTGINAIKEEIIRVGENGTMYFHSVKTPLRDARGNIIGVLGNSFDITDRKKAEEKALQLEKEKATIEAKRQVISDFAASIAHEIGNLLSGVMINAQLLGCGLKKKITELAKKHGDNCQEISELFSNLEKSMKDANFMFESIKMNIRSGTINKAQLELVNIADDIETVLSNCFPGEDIVANIKWNKESSFEYIGISAYTRNILINLIKNAMYFIKEEKKGEITITLKKGEKFNKLIFEDTAKGIPIEILPKIFTRFSTTRRGGSGMGLAFCKMVMQEYGGDITCESEFGKYTRFILTFPAAIIE